MSYHSITPVDRVDPPNDLNDNSDGVLPVDRKESQVPKKSICSYSKLSSTWKTYWQTQTTMLSLFVLGQYDCDAEKPDYILITNL